MFLNHLYGGMDEPELKIIDVFICKLRKKLANASNGKDYIETVWGRGYVLREPSEDEARGFPPDNLHARPLPSSRSAAGMWLSTSQGSVDALVTHGEIESRACR